MKKNCILISALLLCAGVFTSCNEKDPTTLDFQGIYGREDWKTTSDTPLGYFGVAKSSDNITVTEQAALAGAVYKTYTLQTTGTDPYIMTERTLVSVPGKVLSFKYKSSAKITPSIMLDVTNSESASDLWDLEQTSEWKEYTFDLGILISTASWGGLGSSLKLGFGDQAGVTVEISDICVRPRTSAEEASASAFEFVFKGRAPGQMKSFEDITPNIKTFGVSAYVFTPVVGAGDCNMQSEPRSMDITSDYNQCHFEYKCAKPWAIQIFWLVRGGDETNGDPLPAADEWTAVHLDWENVVKNKIFKNYPNAGAKGNVMRIDIDGEAATTGTPVYIRGMRLTKK